MATVDSINDKVAEAVEAIEDEDFGTAYRKLLAAKALLASLPSRSANEGTELEWDASQIDSLIATIQRQRAASAGLQSTDVEWARTPPSDE